MTDTARKNVLTLLAITGLAMTLTACGSGLIRGQPPLVGISSVQLGDGQIQAVVDIHNPNDVDMDVNRFEMSMVLDDNDLGLRSEAPGLSIHPNGTEVIRLELPANPAATEKLQRLENGQRNSVPYTINGRVLDGKGESEKFSQQGYLYPVPGRPGQFRGAGQHGQLQQDQ
ncbi:MAG: LEA type 2 family protein [Xanthomonadales bacterium]|nr:LEA type 2 family protein [Xanthomonadales bacterium]